MSERKGVEKNISIRTVMTIAIIILSAILMVVSVWFRNYLVTAVLGTVPVLSFIYTVARHSYEKNLSSTRTGIAVHVSGNHVVITCSLKSSHPKRLFVDKAYLFVDIGDEVGDDGVYRFKHILRHDYGETSCQVEKKMTAGDIRCYRDINSDGKGFFYELKHLSSATILYLDYNEEFSDDCVVELQDNVYRAMFVVTFKNADCNCAMKHFIVGSNKKNPKLPAVFAGEDIQIVGSIA